MRTATEQAIINTMIEYVSEMQQSLDRLQTDPDYPSEYKQKDREMMISEIERANDHLMGILERREGGRE